MHLNNINAYQAWNYGMGSPNVKIAVIDVGIDKNHIDIGLGADSYRNIDETLGWDYIDNTTNHSPTHSHGTFVAGIIGGKTNNKLQGSKCEVNTYGWESGLYIVRITCNNQVYTRKFTI